MKDSCYNKGSEMAQEPTGKGGIAKGFGRHKRNNRVDADENDPGERKNWPCGEGEG